MTTRILFGYYLPEVADIRQPAISLVAKVQPGDALQMVQDPLKAIADALEECAGARVDTDPKATKNVVVIGAVRDLISPDDQIEQQLWQRSILDVMEAAGVTFIPLDVSAAKLEKMRHKLYGPPFYHTARLLLDQELAKRKKQTIRGRPPYGYRVEKGSLQVDPAYVDAIRTFIYSIEVGSPPAEALSVMKKKFSKEPIKRTGRYRGKRPQFWSYQKLRRIFSRLRLYTLGEYVDSDGRVYIDTSLSILPAELATLTWPNASKTPSPRTSSAKESPDG